MSDINRPKYYEQIRKEPADDAILNIPIPHGYGNRYYMYMQTVHQKPICQGILARIETKYYAELMKSQWYSPEYLKARKIKYVILHEEFSRAMDYDVWKNVLDKNLHFVTEEAGQRLYSAY